MVEKLQDMMGDRKNGLIVFKNNEEAMKAADDLLKSLNDNLTSYTSIKDYYKKDEIELNIMNDSKEFLKKLNGINRFMAENNEDTKKALNLYVNSLRPSIIMNKANGNKIFDDSTAEAIEELYGDYQHCRTTPLNSNLLYMDYYDPSSSLLMLALEKKFRLYEITDIEAQTPEGGKIINDIVSDVGTFIKGLAKLSFYEDDQLKKIIDDANKRFIRQQI